MQSDWLNSALSPVVYGDIVLNINTQYNTIVEIKFDSFLTWNMALSTRCMLLIVCVDCP